MGPAEHLQSIGVTVVHDLRGVGSNLQDHYVARVSHRVKGSISVNRLSRGIRLAREVMRFGLEGRGALTFGITTAQVFCRSTPEKASPDLQLLFTPGSYDEAKFLELEREDGMTVAVCPVRPDSRGTIMARSPDADRGPGHYAELSIRSCRYSRAGGRRSLHPRDFRVAGDGSI